MYIVYKIIGADGKIYGPVSAEQLRQWVDFALSCNAVILFDAAYEAYISDPEIPHSICEIPGAKDVAIEFRSFSKTAGFTGVRCAFIVIPKTLTGLAEQVIPELKRRRDAAANPKKKQQARGFLYAFQRHRVGNAHPGVIARTRAAQLQLRLDLRARAVHQH